MARDEVGGECVQKAAIRASRGRCKLRGVRRWTEVALRGPLSKTDAVTPSHQGLGKACWGLDPGRVTVTVACKVGIIICPHPDFVVSI